MSTQLYTGPITVAASKTIKAVALAPGKTVSDELVAAYVINPTYEGLIATRQNIATDDSTSNKYLMSRSGHIAAADISSLKLKLANFGTNGPGGADIGHGQPALYTASIEYPANVFTQILFGGISTGTVADLGILDSDYATVSIPSGDTFWVRLYYNSLGGCFFTDGQNVAMGDALNVSNTALSDQTMGGTVGNIGPYSFMPLAIIGQTNKASIIIVGDSMGYGYNDDSSVNFLQGIIAKAFSTSVAFLNLSRNGVLASNYTSACSLRLALFPYCSHGVIALGRNDLGGDPTNTIIANLESISAVFPSVTKKIFCPAMMTTTSTDGWTTTANQVLDGAQASRISLNTAIRANSLTGQFNHFETVWPLEDVPDDGLWTVVGGPKTVDGIHPNPAGYTLGSGGVDMSLLVYP